MKIHFVIQWLSRRMLMQMLVQSFEGDEAFHHQGDSDKLEHYNLVTT